MRQYWWLHLGDQSAVTQRSAQLDMAAPAWGNAYAGYYGLMAEWARESVPAQRVSVRKAGVKTHPDAATQAAWNNNSRPPFEYIMHGISVRYLQNPGQMSSVMKAAQMPQPRDRSVQSAQALQASLLASMLAAQARGTVYG